MDRARFFLVLGFILLGVISRLIPHPPNFTAINALALLGAMHLGDRRLALLTVFGAMLLSDGVWGVHSTMVFVYASFGIVIMLGGHLAKRKSLYGLPAYSLMASLLFFVITNLGIWLTTEFYPPTLAGLGLCYVAALPFLGNQVLGDLFYAVIAIGLFEVVQRLAAFKTGCKVS